MLVKIAPDLTWEAVDDVLALVEEHALVQLYTGFIYEGPALVRKIASL